MTWGPTNGELMLAAAMRQAKREMWLQRLGIIILILAAAALVKFLFL